MDNETKQEFERVDTELNHLADSVQKLDTKVDKGFADMNRRFGMIDGKFDIIDQKFDAIDGKFDIIDQKFDAIDGKFDIIDQKFDAIDRKFDAVDQRFDGVDQRLDNLERIMEKLSLSQIDSIERIKWLEENAMTHKDKDEILTILQDIVGRLEDLDHERLAGVARDDRIEEIIHRHDVEIKQLQQHTGIGV